MRKKWNSKYILHNSTIGNKSTYCQLKLLAYRNWGEWGLLNWGTRYNLQATGIMLFGLVQLSLVFYNYQIMKSKNILIHFSSRCPLWIQVEYMRVLRDRQMIKIGLMLINPTVSIWTSNSEELILLLLNNFSRATFYTLQNPQGEAEKLNT